MAIGTITKPTTIPTSRANYTVSNRKARIRDVQLTTGANYTTGGEPITAAQVDMRWIEEVRIHGLAAVTSGATSRSVAVLYQTDGSVKFAVQTTGSAEAASNSDQSTYTVRATFMGR